MISMMIIKSLAMVTYTVPRNRHNKHKTNINTLYLVKYNYHTVITNIDLYQLDPYQEWNTVNDNNQV